MTKNLNKLETNLGIIFKNKNLFQQAFVHRSYLNEHPKCGLEHNERMEFLGDAVLELAVTKYLYENYSNSEGELTIWRAALVNSKILAKIATGLELNKCLLLSKGETRDTGRARQFILANTYEALVGAIYLDQGFEKAGEFIEKNLIVELQDILEKKLYHDPKSRFQEGAQDKLGITPAYEVLAESGPDHAKQFIVGVFLGEQMIAKGKGPSKQIAQEKAAEAGIKKKGWK
jgi:ribonuclease-3